MATTQSGRDAESWFLTCQESQRAEYQRRVGLAFLRGEGVQRNAAVAAHFLRASADLGDAAAQCWLATCYAQGCKQQLQC